MFERSKNIQGFTLAELLLSIAIIVVLAALAIPSIGIVQKNMRMLELDSAASDLAAAAQQQMTSMKTGGTWTNLLDKHSELLADSARAKGVPAKILADHSDEDDLYFMTADQARTLGIIPESSIDDTVRNGDYIIEYSASTATVFGVFYSDGKSGFFQDAENDPRIEKPVQTYYETGALADSEQKRDQSNRLKADPLIGYFGGTPAGTTRAVALANPVIWVNDEGKLCIQDPNLSKHPTWNTTLEVLIKNEKTGSTATLAFAGLQGKNYDTTYTMGVDLQAGSQKLHDNKGLTKFYTVDYRDALVETTGAPDVYVFELDMMKNSNDEYLKNLVKDFTYGDPIKVTATVKTNEKPCVPATATATIEWPKPVAMMRVLVTNPDATKDSERATHITGSYTAPDAYVIDDAGKKSETVKGLTVSENYSLNDTNAALTAENGQAKNQRYSGVRIARTRLTEAQGALFATVGSYKSPTTQTNHAYQIHEIWAGIGANPETSTKQRIGYLSDNKWVWSSGAGTAFSACFNAAQISAGNSTAGITSLTVDPAKVPDALIALGYEGTESLTVYIRTAPSVDDARVYFTGQTSANGHDQLGGELSNIIDALKEADTTVASRNGTTETAKTFRQRFETEFGCPSSDSVWSFTNKEDSGQTAMDNEPFPDNDNKDVRMYYAVTPAFGFGNATINGVSNPDYAASNTALWYYSEKTKTVYAQAMVHDARDAKETSSYYSLLKPQSGSSDFEFHTDQDYLFYRVLKFYETYDPNNSALNKATDLEMQYVPYSVQSNNEYAEAKLPVLPNKIGEQGAVLSQFLGWKAVETYPSGSASPLMAAGDLVGAYHDSLAYVGTNLVAQYQTNIDRGTGLVYLEYSDEAKTQVSGWYGYLGSDQAEATDRLSSDNTIAAWQYGLLTAVGAKEPSCTTPGINFYEKHLTKVNDPIVIDGGQYTLWLIDTNENTMRRLTKTLEYAGSKGSVTYSFNLNFAGAVTKDKNISSAWGTDIPWKVRHSLQFLGSVPQQASQDVYMKHAYEQTHDIDMNTVKDSYKIEQNNAFTGSYNGNDFEISGFERANYFIRDASGGRRTQGFSVVSPSLGYGQGLFPYVRGTDANSVVLKNIRLVASGDDLSSYGTDSNANFGWLVGILEAGRIENCSLVGYDQTGVIASGDNEVKLTLKNASAGTNTLAMLVGKANQSSVANLSVEGIEATFLCRTGEWNDPLVVGGVVGIAQNSTLTSNAIKNVSLALSDETVPRKSGTAHFGGVVGKAESSEISGTNLSASSLSLPSVISKTGGSAYYGILAGSVVSGSTVINNAIADLAVSIPKLTSFDVASNTVVFGGLVGAVGVGDRGLSSSIQFNAIARTTLDLFAGQDASIMSFGWGAGWLDLGTMENNIGTDAPLAYRVGEGEYQDVANEVGR